MLPNFKSSVEKMIKSLHEYPWDNELAYAWFLSQTYYYVCHSTRLLAASAARFSQEDQAFHRRFLKHTDEENSHELLALRDLQKLGYKIEDFPELPQTRTFYEIQYFKIEHYDPAAVMGYILALEAAAGHEFPAIKNKLLGLYPKECVKFIQVHADEDPDHVDKALQVVESLDPKRHLMINVNIEQSAIIYTDMLNACNEKARMKTLKKVA